MGADETEEHLRAASDAIMLLIKEVGQAERLKRSVDPDDPGFIELAAAVRFTADALAEFARQEELWAKDTPVQDVRTIDESVSPPKLAAILERWRAVERALDTAEPGTPEARQLFDEFQRIRDEYLAAFRERDGES